MTTFEKMKAQMQNIAEQAYPNLKKGWGWACTAAVKCTEWCKRAYQRAKPRVIVGAENIRHWFLGLQPRTRIIVAATTGVLVVGMLGLTIAGMSGSGGQSPNVPQASAAVLAMDDTQTEPSDSNIQETVKNDVSKGAEQANEGTVVLAQAASQAARDGAEVPNDDPLVIELKGHTGWVNSVAFSPDGKRIVTGSRDDTARIWDAETGKELQKLEGYASTVNSVAFSPDGKRIVTGSRDDTARIWDAETGKELQKLEGHTGTVNSVALSPDGKRIVTGSDDRTARIWDAETGKELQKLEGHASTVNSVAFSPDGKRIVTGSDDRTTRIWDAETGRELRKLEGHTGRVNSVAFSPDGKKIITGSRDDTRIWDAETGRELRKLEGHTGRVNSVAFSPDGKKIITGSDDRTARIWDAETGKELQKLEGYASTVNSVAFSPDGKKIVTGSTDGTARIWDIAMSVRQRVNTDEWREAARKAGFIYLSEALQQSGFTRLNDFVQFGTVSLRDNLQRADAFDKAEAEEKIKAALAANAQKTFFGEYTYSTADVQVSGDKSSFTMTIPAGFIAAKVEEVSFPLPNVIGRLDSTHQRAISSIVGYGALTNDGTLRVLSAGDFLNIVTVRRVSDPVLYARYRHNSSNIAITVSGNTDSIRELVRNSSNYQIRMQFTNLKHKSDRRDVEYWRINKDKTPIEVILSGTNDWATRQVIPNPFITTDTETVTTISADILKIEIIKIR